MHYRDRFADLSNTLLETRPSIFLPSKLSLVFPSGLFTHVLHPQQNYTNYSRRHTVSKCQVSGLGHYNSYLKFQNARTVIYRECKGEHSSFLIQIFQPFFFFFFRQPVPGIPASEPCIRSVGKPRDNSHLRSISPSAGCRFCCTRNTSLVSGHVLR